MRRGILIVLLSGALLGLGGLVLYTRERLARCAAVPLLSEELLPNANLAAGDAPRMPGGWAAGAAGVELRGPAVDGEGFDLDGDGRALQLLGIANYVETPPVMVQPGTAYCFSGSALTDGRSETRLAVSFRWRDAQGRALAEDQGDWQPVVLWRADAPPAGWSPIGAAFQAPPGAASLVVRLRPASDDRVYLDNMHVRWTTGHRTGVQGKGVQLNAPTTGVNGSQPVVTVAPWPDGYRAALSLSFDWETQMGGLIHSRSDDPYGDNPHLRALRMREGITTTLDLFRPHGIRATYYANGYNFLLGNVEKRQFMGNPTYPWATPTYGWRESWAKTPWFAPDPFGTIQSDPDWYFGDLVPLLLRERQDIQSHTFSHFDGGLAGAQDWRADLEAWRVAAEARGVPAARSLAFPWSSSAGMSYANWDELERAGITSVTRTNWRQRQYMLVDAAEARCAPVPGHERILACPDFYLTPERAPQALEALNHAIESGGMLDIWAHTEEVTTPDQIASWTQIVRYAAGQRDAGWLWIAPLAEIADWQQNLAQVAIENQEPRTKNPEPGEPLSFRVTNSSQHDLQGLTLLLPFTPKRVGVNGQELGSQFLVGYPLGGSVIVDVGAGETLEVQAWPA